MKEKNRNIYQQNIEIYSNLVEKFGFDYKSLNWGSKSSQELRFSVLNELGDLNNKSVLDVGCGLGDLYSWFNTNEINTIYTGVDITPEMIKMAEKRFPQVDFEVKNLIDKNSWNKKYDYIIASGVFAYSNEDFLKSLVEILFKNSNLGIAFNSLSVWSNNKEEGEYYADPIRILDYCRTVTPFLCMRHDYHSGDFTIYMYKQSKK